jgi:hypothetical protein
MQDQHIVISDVLTKLAQQRPLFHSEADFQHAFAWNIQQRLPHAAVRLERPILYNQKLIYIDVWIQHNDTVLAVELKYKTRALSWTFEGEMFALRNQSAQDLGRYDFVKDLQRLEYVCVNTAHCSGYAILLTNDSAYWKQQPKMSVDAAFRLHEGQELNGSMAWGITASAGTMRKREASITLLNNYLLSWQEYSRLDTTNMFRYLVIPVAPPL